MHYANVLQLPLALSVVSQEQVILALRQFVVIKTKLKYIQYTVKTLFENVSCFQSYLEISFYKLVFFTLKLKTNRNTNLINMHFYTNAYRNFNNYHYIIVCVCHKQDDTYTIQQIQKRCQTEKLAAGHKIDSKAHNNYNNLTK